MYRASQGDFQGVKLLLEHGIPADKYKDSVQCRPNPSFMHASTQCAYDTPIVYLAHVARAVTAATQSASVDIEHPKLTLFPMVSTAVPVFCVVPCGMLSNAHVCECNNWVLHVASERVHAVDEGHDSQISQSHGAAP